MVGRWKIDYQLTQLDLNGIALYQLSIWTIALTIMHIYLYSRKSINLRIFSRLIFVVFLLSLGKFLLYRYWLRNISLKNNFFVSKSLSSLKKFAFSYSHKFLACLLFKCPQWNTFEYSSFTFLFQKNMLNPLALTRVTVWVCFSLRIHSGKACKLWIGTLLRVRENNISNNREAHVLKKTHHSCWATQIKYQYEMLSRK